MLSHRQKMLSMHSQHVSLQLGNFFDIFCDGCVIGNNYFLQAESLAKIIPAGCVIGQNYFPITEPSLKIIFRDLCHRQKLFTKS